jgi:hypothetical protein
MVLRNEVKKAGFESYLFAMFLVVRLLLFVLLLILIFVSFFAADKWDNRTSDIYEVTVFGDLATFTKVWGGGGALATTATRTADSVCSDPQYTVDAAGLKLFQNVKELQRDIRSGWTELHVIGSVVVFTAFFVVLTTVFTIASYVHYDGEKKKESYIYESNYASFKMLSRLAILFLLTLGTIAAWTTNRFVAHSSAFQGFRLATGCGTSVNSVITAPVIGHPFLDSFESVMGVPMSSAVHFLVWGTSLAWFLAIIDISIERAFGTPRPEHHRREGDATEPLLMNKDANAAVRGNIVPIARVQQNRAHQVRASSQHMYPVSSAPHGYTGAYGV